MGKRDVRREAVLDHAIGHLLEHGLTGMTLRSVAASAGTSDRMLLYYFRDKDDLLDATLTAMALRVRATLDASAAGRRPFDALLCELRAAFGTAALAPHLRIWLELAARAARGDAASRLAGGRIADLFTAWLETRLDADPGARADLAALMMATLEGCFLLEAVGRGGTADAALAAMGRRRQQP